MSERTVVTSGTAFEEEFGYSRAIKKGNQIRVSGTAPIEDGEVIAPNNIDEQSEYVIEKVVDAIESLDGDASDTVATRIYVRDFDDWKGIASAHREAFADAQPACTLVEVSDMPMDGVLLEIEAEAII
jgi:enamine deaminase RidA (YjgF/YER057c/UK114 family)